MTDEQIIDELGLGFAPEAMKLSTVEGIRNLVELRVIGMVTAMIGDDQEARLTELQESGDNVAMWEWLRNEVVGVDVSEVYEAALKDYIEEKRQQLDEL